jgi:hypothetical protein
MTTESGDPPFPQRDPDLFFELARDRLNTQLSSIDALDSKIGVLFSLSSGLLGILAAVVALRSAGEEAISRPVWGLLVAAGVAYAFVACSAVRAYRARSWGVGPSLLKTWNALWGEDTDARIKWRVANRIWADYENNRRAVRTKTDSLLMAFTGVIIQSLLLVLALVLVAVA